VTGTLVSFHAHPDDEAILTGGTLARAARAGHRVVLVFATRGELGEDVEGVLAESEVLGDRRVVEAEAAARVLGAARVVFLDYHDSGMAGEPTNDAAHAFARADREVAAARLAEVLREEQAEVLTVYDERGGYEHPDHVMVHDVGVRAAALAGTPRLYAATVSRQHYEEVIRTAADESDVEDPADEVHLGVDAARITTTVDVRDLLDVKRAAMSAHESQISETSFFLALDDERFATVFGTEWYIRLDSDRDAPEDWIF
jgi:LmbE family N-acetylglucosaminyl deacetylase